MLTHVRNVVSKVTNAIGIKSEDENKISVNNFGHGKLNCPLTYQRPVFLDLSKEEEKSSLDHKLRRLVGPKDTSIVPFHAGYCETVNGGKSVLNEDCAVALTIVLDSLPKSSCNYGENDGGRKDNEKVTSSRAKNTSTEALKIQPEIEQTKQIPVSGDAIVNNDSACKLQPTSGENHAEKVAPVCASSNNGIEGVVDNSEANSVKLSTNEKQKPTEECNSVEDKTREINASNENHNDCRSDMTDISTETASTTTCAGKSLRLDYFAVFDGHAGEGAALYASAVLHEVLIEKLREVQHLLLKEDTSNPNLPQRLNDPIEVRNITITTLQADNLIVGLLQDVMLLTDEHMKSDQVKYGFSGGCTAIVVVFILGKMYVAGAGDSRAVLYTSSSSLPLEHCAGVTSVNLDDDTTVFVRHMSHDFTPITERRRLQYLAYLKPSLLGEHFTRYEYIRRLRADDLGKKVLHRDYHMTGWTYKEITREDLRLPIISGVGKAKRLLATIGVTRGLGDHNLIALNQLPDVPVKPFMSAVPEVRVHDLSNIHGPNDVLVVASDGLWDVMTSEMVARHVTSTLQKLDVNDPSRYSAAAKDLVLTARGTLTASGGWRMASDKPASVDDITVFVIPLLSASRKHDVTCV